MGYGLIESFCSRMKYSREAGKNTHLENACLSILNFSWKLSFGLKATLDGRGFFSSADFYPASEKLRLL